MASKGKKKAVSQEELRRLMREKQRSAERQRRVESPFAKYTGAGRLVCTLCGEQVKSEAVWQAHVLGRGHKERVARLKQGEGEGEGEGESTGKREGESTGKRKKEEEEEEQVVCKKAKEVEKKKTQQEREEGAGKKAKSAALPADFFQSKGAAGLGLLAGQYGDEEEEEKEEEGERSKSDVASQPPGGAAGLPADFFESPLPGGTPSEPPADESKADPQLPEGFFDDPVKDARVRNVDTPREHMDREWEEFQKEMRMVNSASDAIVAEDDEEGRLERQIDEIDEQIECLRRVELLRARQEAARGGAAGRGSRDEREAPDGEGDAEEDEEELLHVLSRDWRAKGALA